MISVTVVVQKAAIRFAPSSLRIAKRNLWPIKCRSDSPVLLFRSSTAFSSFFVQSPCYGRIIHIAHKVFSLHAIFTTNPTVGVRFQCRIYSTSGGFLLGSTFEMRLRVCDSFELSPLGERILPLPMNVFGM